MSSLLEKIGIAGVLYFPGFIKLEIKLDMAFHAIMHQFQTSRLIAHSELSPKFVRFHALTILSCQLFQ